MTAKADLNKLRKGLTKFLRPICDEGTWIETSSTHGNISCKYDGCSLNFTFPHRPSKTLHCRPHWQCIKCDYNDEDIGTIRKHVFTKHKHLAH